MSDMLPLVDILADAGTDAERADWLFRCPYWVINREHMNIREILRQAGLHAGVAYLDAMLSLTSARRLPDGSIPQTIVMPVHIAAHDLREAARGGATEAQ
ncbi:hypothetical protein [Rhizobium grahamii]|uniref:Uncharacterized protein n=1 Tax=Rhizobium grahamii CCGE 502 TaxID=990285 RepID=S3I8Q6_9HYPH|nr:hypothetical protein [Rhizobium grahamii]EPE95728.1 hypothetical protein RGCCGE502_22800 [Rhizobium grahamii CCGE 502]